MMGQHGTTVTSQIQKIEEWYGMVPKGTLNAERWGARQVSAIHGMA